MDKFFINNYKGESMKILQAELIKSVFETMLDTKGIVGLKIARNLRMINEELLEYNEKKLEIFRKYGREENGQLIVDKDSEHYQDFINELKPYQDMEVSFDFKTFTDEELAESGLNANQMMFLLDLKGE